MSIQDDLDRFTADALYVQEHRQELLQKYPERWIAVYNQEVIDTAKDMRRLVAQLKRRGVDPSQVYAKYLTDKKMLLIVPTVLA